MRENLLNSSSLLFPQAGGEGGYYVVSFSRGDYCWGKAAILTHLCVVILMTKCISRCLYALDLS